MPYKDLNRQREFQRVWIKRRREEWFAEHGPCEKCGSWENLEIHHRDPEKKVTHNVWSWTPERRDAELAKCQVLCKSCHVEATNEQRRPHFHHGTLSTYNYYHCRCPECRAANAERVRYDRQRYGRSGSGYVDRIVVLEDEELVA